MGGRGMSGRLTFTILGCGSSGGVSGSGGSGSSGSLGASGASPGGSSGGVRSTSSGRSGTSGKASGTSETSDFWGAASERSFSRRLKATTCQLTNTSPATQARIPSLTCRPRPGSPPADARASRAWSSARAS